MLLELNPRITYYHSLDGFDPIKLHQLFLIFCKRDTILSNNLKDGKGDNTSIGKLLTMVLGYCTESTPC
jgi:hypothetical protein